MKWISSKIIPEPFFHTKYGKYMISVIVKRHKDIHPTYHEIVDTDKENVIAFFKEDAGYNHAGFDWYINVNDLPEPPKTKNDESWYDQIRKTYNSE